MPELPEVQRVVDSLTPILIGRSLSNVRFGPHDVVEPRGFDLAASVQGQAIVSITRRAKRIVFELLTANRFYIHLGMTGQLLVEQSDRPARPHTHLRADLGDALELRFVDPRRFGGLFWMGTSLESEHNLGPEPFGLSALDFHARLRKTNRPIKTTLLDQSVIAGLGNIYVDESLFLARIHPLTVAGRLSVDRVNTLLTCIQAVLTKAIGAGGSSLRNYVDANGTRGSFQSQHRVYDRAGQPCVVCARPIRRIVLYQRSTHFCPGCQARRSTRRTTE